MSTEEIINILINSKSKSEACRKLGFSPNGTGIRKIDNLGLELKLDLSHFKDKGWYNSFRKYKIALKTCPVCGNNFKAKIGHSREKQTCSYACSNKFFRSGLNNGNYQSGNYILLDGTNRQIGNEYRKICFEYWEHICAIPKCGWDKIIDVHHIDYDHNNNNPKNLIPLCPNHHRLTEINQYKNEINQVIYNLIKTRFN
jgi:hypothetical protein